MRGATRYRCSPTVLILLGFMLLSVLSCGPVVISGPFSPTLTLVAAQKTGTAAAYQSAGSQQLTALASAVAVIRTPHPTMAPLSTEIPSLVLTAQITPDPNAGCGTRGGPGYRLPNGKCASWDDWAQGRR